MTKPLTIGIPVMMSSASEIAALKAAKERIEAATANTDMPVQVGAFLYLTDREAKPENLAKALENQSVARLPIAHAQAPIYQRNSLAFAGEEAARFGGQSQLDSLIDHAAKMRDLSGQPNFTSSPLVVETHPGVVVFGHRNEPNPNPATYSKDYFLENRDAIFETMRLRFSELSTKAYDRGMVFNVENGCVTTVEPDRWDVPENKPQFHYLPGNDIRSLERITGVTPQTRGRSGNLTFDIAHLASAQNIGNQMRENGADSEAATFLALYDCKNWAEYDAKLGDVREYFDEARVIHFSNTTGIGMKLHKTPEVEAKWGKDGGFSGLLSNQQLRETLSYAHGRGLPVMFELAYDFKTIPTKQFRDVDECLEFIQKD